MGAHRHTSGFRSLILAAGLAAGALPLRAQPAGLTDDEMAAASQYLAAALAGPQEHALLQVLTDARLVRDDAEDTAAVYDLVVRYDPRRYRHPMVGRYPLTFEAQFIYWGKRIGLYTRSTRWDSGRYYLHDISTGRQAWIHCLETRELYPTTALQYPPPANAEKPASLIPWYKLLHAAEPGTDLRSMSRWLRSMRDEPRDQVQARARAARADTASASP